ncbi:MAG TPA: hypothetical protein VNM90_29045, partial [Haliangium sp.]|nr:hypothetical protein [Haliangium sp.]
MNIYKFPTGRRLNAVREVARRALALLANDIAVHASVAVAHDTEVLAMESRAEGTSRSRYGTEASGLDRRADSTTVGIEAHLEAQERVYGASSQRGRDAAFVRRKLLPQGAGAITRLPYVSQYERINALIQRARDPEIAPVIERIPELSAMLAELATVNAEYGTAIGAYDRDRPDSQELLAAQARGQELLCEVAALIVARYVLLPELRAERDALLEPILRQNEEIRLAR